MSTATAPRGLHRSLCRELPALVFMSALAVRADTAVTPGELDRFDAQKTSAVLPDGETLAYMDVGTRDGSPLVLIHGYTDSARDWAPLVPLLAGKFRLIIIDLRGHGASSKPQCCYTRFDFAYDIKLLLDALHIKTADIVGHSLGSIVAQTFAVRSVVLDVGGHRAAAADFGFGMRHRKPRNLAGDRPALRLVGIENGRRRPAAQMRRQQPRQVHGVRYAGVHAVTGIGHPDMRGIAGNKRAAVAEFAGDQPAADPVLNNIHLLA